MNNKNLYYCIVFLEFFNENILEQLLSLNDVNYLSIVYKPNYFYSVTDLVKYMEPKKTNYKWKIHSIVRSEISDGEIIDTILDTNYNQSNTNYLIVAKSPKLLNNSFINQANEIITNSKYSSDLFGAISSANPYDIFCTTMSIYTSNEKNRDCDILSKIKELDRKIYEV
jgi:hypothetical protein